jgi:hypothetical protein
LNIERFEIGFAAVAGFLIRLAAEIVLDGLDQGHQLALIVAALREFVRENDLGACVYLCTVGCASCDLLGVAIPFRPRCDAFPPSPAWRPPPSSAGSSPVVSATALAFGAEDFTLASRRANLT